MKVKVGNKVYTAERYPIMVILSESDKKNIANMHPDATKYCCFPDGIDEKEVEKFMEEV